MSACRSETTSPRFGKASAENLIGEEGKGFRYILDGMNAERILVSHESIGDARWFIIPGSSRATTAGRHDP